jgi:hypothetical protein
MTNQMNTLNESQAKQLYQILINAGSYISPQKVSGFRVSIRPGKEILEELNHQTNLRYTVDVEKRYHRKVAASIQNIINLFSDSMIELDNIEDALTLAQVIVDETKLSKEDNVGAMLSIACIFNYQLAYLRLPG